MKRTPDYMDLANTRLIVQVAAYYNAALRDQRFYKELGFTDLEALAAEHAAHWKLRLHELIFTPAGGAV